MITEKTPEGQGWQLEQSYTTLPASLYSLVTPTPVKSNIAVLFNQSLANDLGLHANEDNMDVFCRQLAGNILPEGSNPIAQAYMGHQFGYPNMLGDGRAILLGEQVAPNNKRYDIQLKGAGPTPYSRRGDGRATLSACLREYIISEAMFQLGIPTSRSLAVIATGEPVYRESVQDGGVLTRVMSSHLRVGTFEFASRHLDKPDYETFLKYAVNRHYPHLLERKNLALGFLREVMHKQIDLIVHWMRVGFIHGVMNTDNMSIAGETFDYGPCAFMNAYNPATVFSSIDTNGRYAFANQPSIAQWNLAVLASALIPLIDEIPEQAVEKAKEVIHTYPDIYARKFRGMMQQKLGLQGEEKGDTMLINDLLQWMEMTKADYTNTFAHITYGTVPNDAHYGQDGFKLWYDRWKERIALNKEGWSFATAQMKAFNPVLIPRNHLVEDALESATLGKDFSYLHKLLNVISNPYEINEQYTAFRQPPAGGEENYRTFCNT
jgi:serine/tyrosine/threonine adenylyltransferase